MSHYAPFRRKRLWRRRPRNQAALPEPGLPLYVPLLEPEEFPEPAQSGYTQPEKIRPRAASGMRQKLAYSSLAVLAAASVVVTGLAMAPRTPPPPSEAAEAYLEDKGPETDPEPDADAEPGALSILESELTAALAATDWPGSLEAGETDPELRAVLEEASAGCTAEPSAVRSCSLSPGDMPRTAAVVGDASAAAWVPALRRNLEPLGWRVLSLVHPDCSLPLQAAAVTSEDNECTQHAETVAQAIRDAAPGLVVVSNTRPAEAEGEWEEGLRVLHGQWLAPAGQVIALGPMPQVQDATACRDGGRLPADCTVSLDQAWNAANAAERNAAEAAAAVFLDTAAWFCVPDGRCPAFAGQTPTQQDGAVTPAYAARLDQVLGEAVLSILKE